MLFFLSVMRARAATEQAAWDDTRKPSVPDETAVRAAVEEHYEILSGRDMERLAKYDAIFKANFLTLLTAKEVGMQEYRNLEMPYFYQLQAEPAVWIAFIDYELSVEGLPLLPGATSLCVAEENESFRIEKDYEDMPQKVLDEIQRISESAQVKEWYWGIVRAYEKGPQKREEVQDWLKRYEEEKAEAYTVKPGDCPWDIAERCCGDAIRWTEIYRQNKDVLGDNPSLIYPGQILRVNIKKPYPFCSFSVIIDVSKYFI